MAKGELPKMKYVPNEGRNFSVIPMVYSRARMAFCRSMPTTVYFVTTAKQSQISPNHHQASISTEILLFQLVRTCKHLNTCYLIF